MDQNAFGRPVASIATHLADVSKCKTSITTLMTLDFENAPNKCVLSVWFSTGFTSIDLNAPIKYANISVSKW